MEYAELRLPEGCEIFFVDRPLWREYGWQILGALAVLLFQTRVAGNGQSEVAVSVVIALRAWVQLHAMPLLPERERGQDKLPLTEFSVGLYPVWVKSTARQRAGLVKQAGALAIAYHELHIDAAAADALRPFL